MKRFYKKFLKLITPRYYKNIRVLKKHLELLERSEALFISLKLGKHGHIKIDSEKTLNDIMLEIESLHRAVGRVNKLYK